MENSLDLHEPFRDKLVNDPVQDQLAVPADEVLFLGQLGSHLTLESKEESMNTSTDTSTANDFTTYRKVYRRKRKVSTDSDKEFKRGTVEKIRKLSCTEGNSARESFKVPLPDSRGSVPKPFTDVVQKPHADGSSTGPASVQTKGAEDQCGKCRAGTRRLNLNKYCKRDYAILGKIVERETVDEWVQFSMNIQSVYKRSRDSRLRRGNAHLWVFMKDLSCKCPKIKTNKSYLILGKEKEGDKPGLTMTERSIVIEWKDEWHNRMRRFQRRSRQCK